MSKSKERNQSEHLKSLIRKQEKIIKTLKKEVSRSNKRKDLYNDLEEKMAEEILDQDVVEEDDLDKERCPVCKSDIEITELGKRLLIICDGCGYRKTKMNV